jgi:hypothetical protein
MRAYCRNVRARLIDWDDPLSNDLIAVNQFTIQGPKKERRPDMCAVRQRAAAGTTGVEEARARRTRRLPAHTPRFRPTRRRFPTCSPGTQGVVISDGLLATDGHADRAGQPLPGVEDHRRAEPCDEVPPRDRGHRRRASSTPRCSWTGPATSSRTPATARRMTKIGAKYHQYWAVRKAVHQTIEAVETDGTRRDRLAHPRLRQVVRDGLDCRCLDAPPSDGQPDPARTHRPQRPRQPIVRGHLRRHQDRRATARGPDPGGDREPS